MAAITTHAYALSFYISDFQFRSNVDSELAVSDCKQVKTVKF